MAGEHLKNPIKATKNEMSARQKQLKVIYDLPRVDIESDQAVEERISFYFDYCSQEGLKPTVSGLALALGISPSTIWDWENGRRRGDVSSSRAEIIKKAKNYIEFILDDAAMDNKIHPSTWIFYGKNYFGRKDTQEIEVRAQQPLEEIPLDEIQERVKKIPKNLTVDADFTEE